MLFEWQEPTYLGGLTIIAYRIEFKGADDSYSLIKPECDGSFDSVTTSRKCRVPQQRLQASPISLLQGDVVYFRVAAINNVGDSETSAINNIGDKIE